MSWTEEIKKMDVFWRKALIAAALFVLAAPLGILVIRNLQARMNSFDSGQFVEKLNLPEVDTGSLGAVEQSQKELEEMLKGLEEMATSTATSTEN